jgi:hypothetical protein
MSGFVDGSVIGFVDDSKIARTSHMSSELKDANDPLEPGGSASGTLCFELGESIPLEALDRKLGKH